VDPLGRRPPLVAPKPFEPAAPEVFQVAGGVTVWLVARTELPLVSATLVVPFGSASDPAGKAGLASVTADLLDESAGKRTALELSGAVNDLGASLTTGAGTDGSFVALSVLKKNFAPAFAILSDVVARPRFEAADFRRVSELWKNDLRQRAEDPARVSAVVTRAALYGVTSPYGHPPEGLLAATTRVDLAATKSFYSQYWRPEQAVLVVVGDISRAEISHAVEQGLKGWRPPGRAPVPMVTPLPMAKERPRLVVVDRPGAPQSVVAVARDGVAADDPAAPLLDLLNVALGGSFTSRLNQNLREEHGYTYGVRSSFVEARRGGSFVARAAVSTPVTGAALMELLKELRAMAAEGLRPGELEKSRAQARSELVQAYETTSGLSRHLAGLVLVSLPPSYDAAAALKREAATTPQLSELASHVDPRSATVVVVGPSAEVLAQLAPLELGDPVFWDAEGQPVGNAARDKTLAPTKAP
jgi:predicted Zn-dependent peptidase